mgnify:FL=1
MIEGIIAEAEKLIEKNTPFEFWALLAKSEQAAKSIVQKTEGEVDDFVVVKGKLSLGKGSVVKSGTRIEGNVYIGENCIIGPNAFLRDGTVIADNCHIGTS